MRLGWILFAATALSGADAPPCPSSDAFGRYCAELTIENGVLAHGPSRLENGAGVAPFASEAKAQLDRFFDDALKKLGRPYRVTLTPEQQVSDDEGRLEDAGGSLARLRSATSTIAEYVEILRGWCDGAGQCSAENAMSAESASGVFSAFAAYGDAPLLFDPGSDTFDPGNPLIVFRVPPPVETAKFAIVFTDLGPVAAARRGKALASWLSPLDGGLLRRAAVIERIRQYYDPMGLDPQTDVDIVQQPPLITITEGAALRSIAFPLGLPLRGTEPDWAKVDALFYSVLPDRDFRRGYLRSRDAVRSDLTGASAPVLDYAKRLQAPGGETARMDRVRFPIQQLLLQQNGFSAALTPPATIFVPQGNNQPDRKFLFVDLRLEELDEQPKKDEGGAPAAAETDATGHVQPHVSEAQPQPSFTRRLPQRSDEPSYCYTDERLRRKPIFAGVGFQYRPGQTVRWFLLGEYSQLRLPFGDAGISARAGQGGFGAKLATASFFMDYFLFERLHRRVALQFQGGEDSETNRVLDGLHLNERRTGGLARLEVEWFRDRSGHLFKFFAEGRRHVIGLSRSGAEIGTANVTALDFGGVHLFQSSGSAYPWTFRFEPVIRWAPGIANERPYARGQARLQVHRTLPNEFALDFNGRYEQAAAGTPVFDLPSLGGAESVRGFRRDDALGSRLWSLQNELWTPLAWTGIDVLKKYVKLAGFFDVGDARPVAGRSPGVRSGTGLGARVIYGPVVLRGDAAYGFGDAATGGARLKFYFSVSTNLPF